MTRLQVLKGARALLEKRFVKHALTDGNGGYCARGAIGKVATGSPYRWNTVRCTPSDNALSRAAKAIYPESAYYCTSSHIYVNNQLGKRAILAVFDFAIAQLEKRGKR